MILSPEEYNSLHKQLYDPNGITNFIQIPKDELIYSIDLNARKINGPKTVGVIEEHNAEIVWFSVDRFYDDIDLFNSACFIQYKNALGEPFYFATSLVHYCETEGKEKLLIPWIITNDITKKAGVIEYSFRFFATTKKEENKKVFSYVLNTTPATAQVQSTINMEKIQSAQLEDKIADRLSVLEYQIANLSQDYNLYWYTN